MDDVLRDYITVEEEDGTEKLFAVEAMFDMRDKIYALLRSEGNQEDSIVMQVKIDEDNQQYLVGINNREETSSLLDVYQITVGSNPAE